MGDRPNLIVIVVDTLRTDALGCYGGTRSRTPNIDALARRSALFLDAYAEALPTLPARRALYTGRRVFPSVLYEGGDSLGAAWRGWHGLYDEDLTLAETLRDAQYTTALVSDVHHQFKPVMNFHRGFMSWRWIRGIETDTFQTGPRSQIYLDGYAAERYVAADDYYALAYLQNRCHWKREEDWPTARLFAEASSWLENNAGENQPFYLHLESFAPHECWDPPDSYYSPYAPPGYGGPRLFSPPQDAGRLAPLELEHVRALYWGYVAFVDAMIGRFLAAAERMGALDRTVVALVADHGTFLGERGGIGKGEGSLRRQLTQVPLLIAHPERLWAGRRVGGFVQHPDLMPTLLDTLGVGIPSRVTGESLKPLLDAGEPSRRERIVSGWNDHGAIRTRDWLYIGRWNPGEAYEELYDLPRDPQELDDVLPLNPALRNRFRAELKDYIAAGWAVTKGAYCGVRP
jgi:arylsulfatase A-like enzyme